LLLTLALIAGVIGSALGVAYQVFLYRESFQALQDARKERERLDIEWGKLLIEQQTFGATTQIGGRAVMTLRMYSPPPNQTVTLSLPDSVVMTR
jgi:cell division protein FtsL